MQNRTNIYIYIYIHTRKTQDKAIFPERTVTKWVIQLTMALHYLHEKHVLHRDLKCKNIFLRGGQIKLGDFGYLTLCVRGGGGERACAYVCVYV